MQCLLSGPDVCPATDSRCSAKMPMHQLQQFESVTGCRSSAFTIAVSSDNQVCVQVQKHAADVLGVERGIVNGVVQLQRLALLWPLQYCFLVVTAALFPTPRSVTAPGYSAACRLCQDGCGPWWRYMASDDDEQSKMLPKGSGILPVCKQRVIVMTGRGVRAYPYRSTS